MNKKQKTASILLGVFFISIALYGIISVLGNIEFDSHDLKAGNFAIEPSLYSSYIVGSLKNDGHTDCKNPTIKLQFTSGSIKEIKTFDLNVTIEPSETYDVRLSTYDYTYQYEVKVKSAKCN
ncbi:MAG: hypothetical protein E7167_00765 [Firmicutes bacterium]|nr:hypothetical protein [Bacillota bacterium]